jgi:hypothetical protein
MIVSGQLNWSVLHCRPQQFRERLEPGEKLRDQPSEPANLASCSIWVDADR